MQEIVSVGEGLIDKEYDEELYQQNLEEHDWGDYEPEASK